MKRFFYHFLFLLTLFWLEAALQKAFGPSYLIPQLLVLFITVFAVSRELKESLYWCFIVGLLGELFSGLYFGTFIFLCIVACLNAYFVTRKITSQEVSFSTVAVILALQAVTLPLAAYFFTLAVGGLSFTPILGFKIFFNVSIFTRFFANYLLFFPINKLFKIFLDE